MNFQADSEAAGEGQEASSKRVFTGFGGVMAHRCTNRQIKPEWPVMRAGPRRQALGGLRFCETIKAG